METATLDTATATRADDGEAPSRPGRRGLTRPVRNALLTAHIVVSVALIVTVLLVGGFVLGTASNEMLDTGDDTTGRLIAGATYDVIALTVATGLGVFKPGRAFRHRSESR